MRAQDVLSVLRYMKNLYSRSLALSFMTLSFAILSSCDSSDKKSSSADKPSGGASESSKDASSVAVNQDKPKAEDKKDEASLSADEIGEEDAGDRLAYSYNPIGKRDPFKSFITKETVATDSKIETPLQRYEIDQYSLVGIIWGGENPVAMVEDPDGMGYFLKKDSLIGRNWGKVAKITQTEIIVAEEYRDFEGKLIVNEISLKLPHAQGTKAAPAQIGERKPQIGAGEFSFELPKPQGTKFAPVKNGDRKPQSGADEF